jgi:hypothetical protein
MAEPAMFYVVRINLTMATPFPLSMSGLMSAPVNLEGIFTQIDSPFHLLSGSITPVMRSDSHFYRSI